MIIYPYLILRNNVDLKINQHFIKYFVNLLR